MGFKSAVVRFIRSRFGASKDLGKMAFGRNSGIDNDIKEKYGLMVSYSDCLPPTKGRQYTSGTTTFHCMTSIFLVFVILLYDF